MDSEVMFLGIGRCTDASGALSPSRYRQLPGVCLSSLAHGHPPNRTWPAVVCQAHRPQPTVPVPGVPPCLSPSSVSIVSVTSPPGWSSTMSVTAASVLVTGR